MPLHETLYIPLSAACAGETYAESRPRPCRNRTVTVLLTSSISGTGIPALLVDSAILSVPLPHSSMIPRR